MSVSSRRRPRPLSPSGYNRELEDVQPLFATRSEVVTNGTDDSPRKSRSRTNQSLAKLESPKLLLNRIGRHSTGRRNSRANQGRDSPVNNSTSSAESSNSSETSSRTITGTDPLQMRSLFVEDLCPTPKSSLRILSLPLWTLSARGHKPHSLRTQDVEFLNLLPRHCQESIYALIGHLDPIGLEAITTHNRDDSITSCMFLANKWIVRVFGDLFSAKSRMRSNTSTTTSDTQIDMLRNTSIALQQDELYVTLVRQELRSPGSVILNYYLEVKPIDVQSPKSNSVIMRKVTYHDRPSDSHDHVPHLVHEYCATEGVAKLEVVETRNGRAKVEHPDIAKLTMDPQGSTSQLSLS